jgi:hypothetical protein
MARTAVDQVVVLMSLKVVQPALLSDVYEGVQRLIPPSVAAAIKKEDIRQQLVRLHELDLVCLYAGRRYMLTDAGRDYVAITGIRLKLDARRMFLLKETRRRNVHLRSGTRDGSLKQ